MSIQDINDLRDSLDDDDLDHIGEHNRTAAGMKTLLAELDALKLRVDALENPVTPPESP